MVMGPVEDPARVALPVEVEVLVQAARTLTPSAATTLILTECLENQGRSALTPGPSFLRVRGSVGYVRILTFERYTGPKRFPPDECREICRRTWRSTRTTARSGKFKDFNSLPNGQWYYGPDPATSPAARALGPAGPPRPAPARRPRGSAACRCGRRSAARGGSADAAGLAGLEIGPRATL